jgi:regulator of RNase E activity RraA
MKAEYTNYDPAKNVREELRPFLELTTPVVTDAMNRRGAMYGLHCLLPGKQMLGPAKTCRILQGDWWWVCKAIDEMEPEPGQVLVVDMGGTESVSIHGDLSNAGLINVKATGCVVDGGIRDVQDLRVMGVPCYYRHISPNAGNPHEDGGTSDVPVVAGGQVVRPDDILFGDDNGVVVIPHESWEDVLERAQAQERYEQETAAKIFAGGPMLSYER